MKKIAMAFVVVLHVRFDNFRLCLRPRLAARPSSQSPGEASAGLFPRSGPTFCLSSTAGGDCSGPSRAAGGVRADPPRATGCLRPAASGLRPGAGAGGHRHLHPEFKPLDPLANDISGPNGCIRRTPEK